MDFSSPTRHCPSAPSRSAARLAWVRDHSGCGRTCRPGGRLGTISCDEDLDGRRRGAAVTASRRIFADMGRIAFIVAATSDVDRSY
jgi:hypothetical protein